MGLFDNPFYREQMFALGLRPETAYGCAYDFLLYPQSKARDTCGLNSDIKYYAAPKDGVRLCLRLFPVPAIQGKKLFNLISIATGML